MDSKYLHALKQALVGEPDARFTLICNFEVEQHWSSNYVGLPLPKLSASAPIVQRMEELGALLGGPRDVLCLGGGLDPDYRDYAEGLGLQLPAELVVDEEPGQPADSGPGTSQRILCSPATLRRLRDLATSGAYLMPMGVSADEQKISEATGLPLAAPDSDTAERVNSKIYGRRLVEELGIRPVPGTCCETVDELRQAVAGPLDVEPVIVKEAYGVSGKGLVVLDSPVKARRLLRMVEQRAARTGSRVLHLVVERYLAKKCDLNYQFTIDPRGRVRFDFVKEALTSAGVHQGHLMPAELTPAQRDRLRATAELLGGRLFADGFFGVVGVDAILGADDTLYPVLEINARLNMSSYQGALVERFAQPGGAVLAKHYRLRLPCRVGFEHVRAALGALTEPQPDGSRLVVCCFGTVNAQAHRDPPFEGRLYAMLFGPDRPALSAMDQRATVALGRLNVPEVVG